MAKDVDEQFKCGNGTKSGYDAVMVVVCFVYINIVVLVFGSGRFVLFQR